MKTFSWMVGTALTLLPMTATAERGSDGDLRILYWQAASTMNPYLSGIAKEVEAASLVLEPLARFEPARQDARGLLVADVLDEPLDQLPTWVDGLALVVQLGARHQHPGFDLDEQRGRVDEVRRRVQVDVLQHAHCLQKLVCDPGDRDVVDVDLVPPDEEEQEVERPFELVELDAVHAGGRLCGSYSV